MTDPIRVLIVDDISETRDHLSKLLGFERWSRVSEMSSTMRTRIGSLMGPGAFVLRIVGG